MNYNSDFIFDEEIIIPPSCLKPSQIIENNWRELINYSPRIKLYFEDIFPVLSTTDNTSNHVIILCDNYELQKIIIEKIEDAYGSQEGFIDYSTKTNFEIHDLLNALCGCSGNSLVIFPTNKNAYKKDICESLNSYFDHNRVTICLGPVKRKQYLNMDLPETNTVFMFYNLSNVPKGINIDNSIAAVNTDNYSSLICSKLF